ncbi:MAG: ion transporter [Sphingobacteriaceae bacterium]|nr:ion transporter [Sphingobacteriaceae bacterium]
MKGLFKDRNIAIIIVLNSLIILLEAFDSGVTGSVFLEFFDNLFTIYFVVELIVKIKILGPNGYFKDGWNLFDFTLVLLALPSLLVHIIGDAGFQMDFLLIFRVLRIFKFFRFFKLVPNIEHLIRGIRAAMRSSVLILLTFFLFTSVVAVVSSFLFKELSPVDFGDPIRSFYSIFKVFTIEGWYDIPENLSSGLSPFKSFWIKSYFIFILIMGGIFGLSLVNSIFVDAMMEDNNKDLNERLNRIEEKLDRLR